MTAVLSCTNVTKQFGSLKAVEDVTLSIEKGARHALIGPNGAGKSTLFNLVAGTLRPTSGAIMLDGVDVTRRSAAWRSRAGLAKTFQHSSLFLSLPVADNVAMAAQRTSGQGMSLRRPAHRLPGVDDVVAECLAATGLSGRASRPVSDLSHGERRQLEVAVALATRPQLLLLDEPTAGMSAAESGRFAELIESLPGDVTVLIIEHDLEVVFRLAERISVLHLGRLLADDDRESIRQNEQVQRAYLGDARPEDLFHPAAGL
ncbi:ABC transporter ATP-binding protein [Modestobacter muralis]|uniref:ABC transporter ATP-binding protein n=1 Tax=Modestobacter muralis TaxID=1608614 RepID=A0A6P0EU62_9ACTN|nr:ABC transporter ATP-binding protein [Modestobacter muralis]NEK95241.1 ABC transporter ATP-binding protein [Modestobacter muralis]NEN52129.1 ABC transporter ATP-binding protein [Modestobacter muralis]